MQSLEKPERFQKLVVVDSCPVFSHGAHGMVSYLRLMTQADFYKAERESDGSLPGVRAYFMDVWKDAVPNELVRQFLLTNLELNGHEFGWRLNLKAIEEYWPQIVGFPDSDMFGCKYNGPALFVAGGKSEHIRYSNIPAIKNYFPRARVVRVANAGHWVHVDAPHTLLALLTAFVKGPAEQLPLENVEELN
ncbi:Alpha/beta hydrolase [Fasciolopsis buskii]|uniref:sn-1-specific diacylglycerol lipase ABHD11 n=1 Tax=Fasciolopsis buskii TaxID=27845 RepID=A0A8E0VEE5_9TREM|nr:Alpha/beta hydrolase [Fasciolopsis buski]